MTQKLTEEQQRNAHKIIKANRGDCLKNSNYLNCCDCPNFFDTCGLSPSKEFQSENLRRSQAWLDTHITDAEIMAESPREFCERMVRTDGLEKCFAMIKGNGSLCKTCVLSVNECPCNPNECFDRAKAYLASHPATPQEPAKRRPTPEMLDYVDPEKVVKPKPVADTPTPDAKEKGDTTVKGDVDKLPPELRFINFRDLLPVDALRIIALEGQVDDLTKKLDASKKLCERQQRRLRANWEAKHDSEMATREEIIEWFDSKKGAAMIRYEGSKICPNGHSSWIPATRGNLKL